MRPSKYLDLAYEALEEENRILRQELAALEKRYNDLLTADIKHGETMMGLLLRAMIDVTFDKKENIANEELHEPATRI